MPLVSDQSLGWGFFKWILAFLFVGKFNQKIAPILFSVQCIQGGSRLHVSKIDQQNFGCKLGLSCTCLNGQPLQQQKNPISHPRRRCSSAKSLISVYSLVYLGLAIFTLLQCFFLRFVIFYQLVDVRHIARIPRYRCDTRHIRGTYPPPSLLVASVLTFATSFGLIIIRTTSIQ